MLVVANQLPERTKSAQTHLNCETLSPNRLPELLTTSLRSRFGGGNGPNVLQKRMATSSLRSLQVVEQCHFNWLLCNAPTGGSPKKSCLSLIPNEG
jgi:hypothetical protein